MWQRAVVLTLLVGSLAGTSLADEPSAVAGRVSKRMSDAILTEFRNMQIQPRLPAGETPVEADPNVVVLPELLVREQFDLRALHSDPRLQSPDSRSLSSTLGSGITEYRGKKISVLTQRILFIPLGFKLAW